jgi:hypothetical protein
METQAAVLIQSQFYNTYTPCDVSETQKLKKRADKLVKKINFYLNSTHIHISDSLKHSASNQLFALENYRWYYCPYDLFQWAKELKNKIKCHPSKMSISYLMDSPQELQSRKRKSDTPQDKTPDIQASADKLINELCFYLKLDGLPASLRCSINNKLFELENYQNFPNPDFVIESVKEIINIASLQNKKRKIEEEKEESSAKSSSAIPQPDISVVPFTRNRLDTTPCVPQEQLVINRELGSTVIKIIVFSSRFLVLTHGYIGSTIQEFCTRDGKLINEYNFYFCKLNNFEADENYICATEKEKENIEIKIVGIYQKNLSSTNSEGNISFSYHIQDASILNITAMKMLPRNRLALSYSCAPKKSTFAIYDLAQKIFLKRFDFHNRIYSIYENNSFAIIGGSTFSLNLYNLKDSIFEIREHRIRNTVMAVYINGEGSLVLAGTDKGILYVFSVQQIHFSKVIRTSLKQIEFILPSEQGRFILGNSSHTFLEHDFQSGETRHFSLPKIGDEFPIIKSMAINNGELLIGLQSGALIFIPLDKLDLYKSETVTSNP